MRRSPILVVLTLAACAQQQRGPGPGRFPPPDISLSQPQAVVAPGVPQLPGFSTAVKVGNTVYLSGQVPLDSAGGLVGRGDLNAQALQTLSNVARVIRSAHGVPADLVQITVYVVGYDTSAAGIVRRAVAPYAEPKVPPALTIVGVASLPEPGMLIAVDGVAVLRGLLPDKTRDRGR
jgi:enamine deaminase RidA (YjgF/YER057c/UK114 family)